MNHRHRLTWVLALLLVCTAAGCLRSRPANVVIILVDTLRPDRLGAYGDERALTPAMDALAASGTVFRNAYAQSSWTNPSVASLFTSRYQSQHGVTSFASKLSDSEETLAELFKARGYTTAAFVANVLLQGSKGFAQGFDHWQVVVRPDPNAPPDRKGFLKGRGDGVNQAAFAWLDEHGRTGDPLFLYVHYMEPHAPYDPPVERINQQRQGGPEPDIDGVNRYFVLPGITMPDDFLPDARLLYDAEVASVDTAIGALLAGLRARGVLDDAMVVLVSDHGEELKEHGLVGHHQTLYEEVIRVPLIIAATGRPRANVIDEVVSLTDIAPTLLELTGAGPQRAFEGQSLARTVGKPPWWRRGEDGGVEPRPAYSELIKTEDTLRLSPHEHAAVETGTKLITGVGGERSYYDLHTDPGETNPDALAPGQRAALDRALDTLRTVAARHEAPQRPAIDADTRERMRALGYLE